VEAETSFIKRIPKVIGVDVVEQNGKRKQNVFQKIPIRRYYNMNLYLAGLIKDQMNDLNAAMDKAGKINKVFDKLFPKPKVTIPARKICKHWKDYNEPDVCLEEVCDLTGKSTICGASKEHCEAKGFEEYKRGE
jgi:hypothetical protein